MISPRWIYLIQLAGDRRTEDVDFEGVMVGCELCDTMWLRVGKFKLPFLREELTSSKRQLAVERSFVGAGWHHQLWAMPTIPTTARRARWTTLRGPWMAWSKPTG